MSKHIIVAYLLIGVLAVSLAYVVFNEDSEPDVIVQRLPAPVNGLDPRLPEAPFSQPLELREDGTGILDGSRGLERVDPPRSNYIENQQKREDCITTARALNPDAGYFEGIAHCR